MAVQIDKNTNRVTLIANGQRHEADAIQVNVYTDTRRNMSVAELSGHQVYITEPEADALTVAGAADKREHVKSSTPGSVI
jgi:hypothetical protein